MVTCQIVSLDCSRGGWMIFAISLNYTNCLFCRSCLHSWISLGSLVDHCYLFSWSKIGCKSAESLQMFLWRWHLLIKTQLKLSNRVHQLLPGSSGCSWPGPARRESSLADSEASAPHPRAPPSYSCGAYTAAGAPLTSGPHKHTWITSTRFYHISKHIQQ